MFIINRITKIFGDRTHKGQRVRAWWLIVILLFVFGFIAYLWIGYRTTLISDSSLWIPWDRIQNIQDKTLKDLQWLDWFFTGTMGTIIYLLWEVAQKYQLLNDPVKSKDVDFINKTPWYIVVALRGPVIVLVVMFTLTNITFSAALTGTTQGTTTNVESDQSDIISDNPDSDSGNGNEIEDRKDTQLGNDSDTNNDTRSEQPDSGNFDETEDVNDTQSDSNNNAIVAGIDLSKADYNLLALIAFMLGFFNRLPVHIMEDVMSKIFNKSFKAAYPER